MVDGTVLWSRQELSFVDGLLSLATFNLFFDCLNVFSETNVVHSLTDDALPTAQVTVPLTATLLAEQSTNVSDM